MKELSKKNNKKPKNSFDKKKEIKGFIIAFIKSFLICGFATFIGLVIETCIVKHYELQYEELRELESPYNIAQETVDIVGLAGPRGILLGFSIFPKENFLSNYWKNKQLNAYKSLQAKLPKGDLLLDIAYYDIYKAPYIRAEYHSKDFDDSLIEYLHNIKNKFSVVKQAQKHKH